MPLRSKPRRFVSVVAGVAVAVSPLLVSPAHAGQPSALDSLKNELATCTNAAADPYRATLTVDIDEAFGSLVVNCSAVLDLAGHRLRLYYVVAKPGVTLTVTDQAGTNCGLTADASKSGFGGNSYPGIENDGARVVIAGDAKVCATGGRFSPGIGGGDNQAGGTLQTLDNASLSAVGGEFGAGIGGGVGSPGGIVSSYGSSVIRAASGGNGAGIGGGGKAWFSAAGGPGGITEVRDFSQVIATAGKGTAAAIGSGDLGSGPGRTSLFGLAYVELKTSTDTADTASLVGTSAAVADADLPYLSIEGGNLRLNDGHLRAAGSSAKPSVVVGSGGAISRWNDGTAVLDGPGLVQNDGAILVPAAAVLGPVIGYHYEVTFDPRGGTLAATTPNPVTVYAKAFNRGRAGLFPADPVRGTETFTGWTVPSGVGTTPLTQTSPFPGTSSDGAAVLIAATATYAEPKSKQEVRFTSTAPATAHPGDRYQVATETVGDSTEPVVVKATGPCTIDDKMMVTFTDVGDCALTADRAGDAATDPAPTAKQLVSVTAAPAPPPAPVPQAQSVRFDTEAPTAPTIGGTYRPQASASSGLPVTVGAHGPACELSAGVVILVHAGACTVTASQEGDQSYSAAVPASQTITVNQAPSGLRITSGPPLAPVWGARYDVATTSDSPVPVALATNGPCELAGSAVTFGAAGDCVVTATQAADEDHLGSTRSQTITVVSGPAPTISGAVTQHDPATPFWYRGTVTATFTCTAGAAPITICPDPTTMSEEGVYDLDVTTTAADGQTATISWTSRIDRTMPTRELRLMGSRAPGTCRGTDELSGVATCTVAYGPRIPTRPQAYTATVTDRAGNVRTVRGTTERFHPPTPTPRTRLGGR